MWVYENELSERRRFKDQRNRDSGEEERNKKQGLRKNLRHNEKESKDI